MHLGEREERYLLETASKRKIEASDPPAKRKGIERRLFSKTKERKEKTGKRQSSPITPKKRRGRGISLSVRRRGESGSCTT